MRISHWIKLVVRTCFGENPDEVSVLCEAQQDLVMTQVTTARGFRVAGQLEFNWWVLAELTGSWRRRKSASSPSRHTDYIFIEESAVESATTALQDAGFKFDT